MQFINVHAESGGSQDSRDYRASQLQYLARAHESAARDACVLVGDLNLRPGEDKVLCMYFKPRVRHSEKSENILNPRS